MATTRADVEHLARSVGLTVDLYRTIRGVKYRFFATPYLDSKYSSGRHLAGFTAHGAREALIFLQGYTHARGLERLMKDPDLTRKLAQAIYDLCELLAGAHDQAGNPFSDDPCIHEAEQLAANSLPYAESTQGKRWAAESAQYHRSHPR